MIPSKISIRFDFESQAPDTEVVVQRIADIDTVGMHTHEFIEIAFVQAGHGWHVLGDHVSRSGPGSIYVIDYSEAHMFMSDGDEPMIIWNLIFRPGFFGFFSTGGQGLSNVIQNYLLRAFRYGDFSHSLEARFEGKELLRISGLFDDMLDEYERREPGFEELIRSWTVELMVYIFRRICATEEHTTSVPRIKTDILNRVFEYIQENYTESISLEKLAMLAFVSPKYFSRLFKTHTGCTVTEYTQKLRIGKACELLDNSESSLAEISEQVGYNDIKYFSRVFRRLMGMSPAEYRRRKRD